MESFESVKLICPRCRRVDEHGNLKSSVLRCFGRGQVAVLGALEDVPALECRVDGCGGLYPVVDGIPVITRAPESLDLKNNSPWNVLSLPPETLLAMLTNMPRESGISRLFERLARYAWAAFRDWMPEEWGGMGEGFEVHGVELIEWLEEKTGPLSNGLCGVMGAAMGREAWSLNKGPVVLMDLHLPSLLLSKMLQREGRLRIPMPIDAARWALVNIEMPTPPVIPSAMLCGDVIAPPFEAEIFDTLIAPNLIDSVQNPFMMLGQCCALVASGGSFCLSSPFTWREEITVREDWLSTHRIDAAEQVISLASRQFEMDLRARTTLSWVLRNGQREAVLYRSEVLAFQKVNLL